MAEPNLQMFRSDSPTTEIGTEGVPVDFGFCTTGEVTDLPYEILLYNDKTGSTGSDPAKDLTITVEQFNLTEVFTSDGLASQTKTITSFPILATDIIVDVNGSKYAKVSSFSGYTSTSEVYMVDITTGIFTFGNGVQGKIPPNGETITITYNPDSTVYGADIYEDLWLSIKSDGVLGSPIAVSVEEATKTSNTEVSIVHCPLVTSVVGVWDNIGKTGTNYYTGGGFNSLTGVITLGTPLTATIPYVEYTYQIMDDAGSTYTPIGKNNYYYFTYSLPPQSAKRLQLKVTVPSTADTEGGVYIRVKFRISYQY